MKTNGNDQRKGDYYLGLDVGTSSIGWAVTDKEYNILKFKGNAMWGVRLFDEAQGAADRRSFRTARRRLARRKQRILLLEMLFAEELAKVDPKFLTRMHESYLWTDDKSSRCKFSLFNDPSFTDKDYHREYPTIYHLRQELMDSTEKHDIRLVYLALHHILKSRGHFLYEDSFDSGEVITIENSLNELSEFLFNRYSIEFKPADKKQFTDILVSDLGITAKKKQLNAVMNYPDKDEEEPEVSLKAAVEMLTGASVKLADLYCDEELKNADIKSFSLKTSIDDQFDELSMLLGDRIDLLLKLKDVFDTVRLNSMLKNAGSISEAKVALYDQNKKDLAVLKKYVKENAPDKYKKIFSEKKDKLNNYVAYSRYEADSGSYRCSQEEFCKFLKAELPEPAADDKEAQRIFTEITDKSFLPRLKGSDNGVIPYQLHKRELTAILNNAGTYLPFLNECDGSGMSVKDKLIKTFEFRVPYYVGPVNPQSPYQWAERFPEKENEKIYPWNFEKIVDMDASISRFIEKLIGRCTYTGEKVLPKNSLLYSEFMLLNEINMLRVNGKELPQEARRQMIDDLFYKSKKKVTKKRVTEYLLCNGFMQKEDTVSGIDDNIKASLKSYHDFEQILDKTHDEEMVENIIHSILVFGGNKKMLRSWLRGNTHELTEADIAYICRLKYSDWGRLSRTFLTEIYSPAEDGEAKSVMDLLREKSVNLMQLMSSEYLFAEKAAKHRDALLGSRQTLDEKLDDLYIAPAVRRAIRQTIYIVDEITDIMKAAPAKIFIEVARGSAEEMKNKRTESRKEKLLALYKSCREDSGELFERLEKEDDSRLRSERLYLYYTQLGRCMYTGEPIDFSALAGGELYDTDHIFPRSRIKDDSLDNKVLVKENTNREKTNVYPISADVRKKMYPFWTMLKQKGFISEKKYERLVRSYPLTDKELSDFVARQLVETRQSTKALAGLLQDKYGGNTRIIYSKAGNVSGFRQDFDLIKCREVNDLHHAKDAYLNIVVGNVYNTKFTDRFFANIRNEDYSLNKVFSFDVKGAWDKQESIKTVKKYMMKNNILFTRMPIEAKGKLFKVQLKPAGKGQLEKKQGLPIEKYGGYNEVFGAYFFVVEHTEKNKRVRTVEPVLVYQKARYENDPIKYCREVLGLTDPAVIVYKIKINTLLELDNKLLHVSSRSGDSIRYKHAYQLTIDYEWEKYIKALRKYADRCAAVKKELPITKYDGITKEKNVLLYDLFIKKCSEKIFADLFKNMQRDMIDNRGKFIEFSYLDQTVQLLEILKAFLCNAQIPNFKRLCGKDEVAKILINKKISNLKSAYLINQSVTGLYQTKTDLLK